MGTLGRGGERQKTTTLIQASNTRTATSYAVRAARYVPGMMNGGRFTHTQGRDRKSDKKKTHNKEQQKHILTRTKTISPLSLGGYVLYVVIRTHD